MGKNGVVGALGMIFFGVCIIDGLLLMSSLVRPRDLSPSTRLCRRAAEAALVVGTLSRAFLRAAIAPARTCRPDGVAACFWMSEAETDERCLPGVREPPASDGRRTPEPEAAAVRWDNSFEATRALNCGPRLTGVFDEAGGFEIDGRDTASGLVAATTERGVKALLG